MLTLGAFGCIVRGNNGHVAQWRNQQRSQAPKPGSSPLFAQSETPAR